MSGQAVSARRKGIQIILLDAAGAAFREAEPGAPIGGTTRRAGR